MQKAKHYWLWILIIWIIWQVVGCGPETIFMRPALDTPEQHVYNGHILLGQKKLKDAKREFERARELDPGFTEAYVGLGLVLGHQGEVENALRMFNHAKTTITSDKDYESVDKGFEQFQEILEEKGIAPPQR